MSKDKFYNTDAQEQETIINIDYYAGQVSVYTNRKNTLDKLEVNLGEPAQKFLIKRKLSGAKWNISFSDKKRLDYVFSRPNIIGQASGKVNCI